MNYGIFSMHTDENALKVDSRRKIPRCTGELNLHRWCAGPMFYHLSYVPTHRHLFMKPKAQTATYKNVSTHTLSNVSETFKYQFLNKLDHNSTLNKKFETAVNSFFIPLSYFYSIPVNRTSDASDASLLGVPLNSCTVPGMWLHCSRECDFNVPVNVTTPPPSIRLHCSHECHECDCIAPVNMTALLPWLWLHCSHECDSTVPMNVTALFPWMWLHCTNKCDCTV